MAPKSDARKCVRQSLSCAIVAKIGHQFVVIWKVAGETKRKTYTDEATAMSEAAFKAEQLNAGRVDAAELTIADRDELVAARELAGQCRCCRPSASGRRREI